MRKLFKYLLNINSSLSKGFTLIELLVVIGILGILASALVATIDPFEQLNKAQDANVKNTSVEFLNANIRYFTTHNALPWFSTANGGAACNGNTFTLGGSGSGAQLSTLTTCLTTLVSEGELKQGFTTFNGLNKIYATNPNPQPGSGVNDVIVCFKPTSKSQQKDVAAKYNQDGSLATASTCKSAVTSGGVDCYWCTQ